VFVADQDEALDFYVTKLGWEKRADNPFGEGSRWLTVAPPGAATELVLGLARDYGADQVANNPQADCGISLLSSDIDATYQTLVERGVQFRHPPEAMPWGTKATWFSDPDGNTFFLSQE
jgi:catechol 2,3-dioxygenase-like lactoylglutathione lyase family enzyme